MKNLLKLMTALVLFQATSIAAEEYAWTLLTAVSTDYTPQYIAFRGGAYEVVAPTLSRAEVFSPIRPPFPMWSNQAHALHFLFTLPDYKRPEAIAVATELFIVGEIAFHQARNPLLDANFLRPWILNGIYINLVSMLAVPGRKPIDLALLYTLVRKPFSLDHTDKVYDLP